MCHTDGSHKDSEVASYLCQLILSHGGCVCVCVLWWKTIVFWDVGGVFIRKNFKAKKGIKW